MRKLETDDFGYSAPIRRTETSVAVSDHTPSSAPPRTPRDMTVPPRTPTGRDAPRGRTWELGGGSLHSRRNQRLRLGGPRVRVRLLLLLRLRVSVRVRRVAHPTRVIVPKVLADPAGGGESDTPQPRCG